MPDNQLCAEKISFLLKNQNISALATILAQDLLNKRKQYSPFNSINGDTP
jgi:hypothetical protein